MLQHTLESGIEIPRELEHFVMGHKMSAKLSVVDTTSALNTDERVVCSIDDEAVIAKDVIGVCV